MANFIPTSNMLSAGAAVKQPQGIKESQVGFAGMQNFTDTAAADNVSPFKTGDQVLEISSELAAKQGQTRDQFHDKFNSFITSENGSQKETVIREAKPNHGAEVRERMHERNQERRELKQEEKQERREIRQEEKQERKEKVQEKIQEKKVEVEEKKQEKVEEKILIKAEEKAEEKAKEVKQEIIEKVHVEEHQKQDVQVKKPVFQQSQVVTNTVVKEAVAEVQQEAAVQNPHAREAAKEAEPEKKQAPAAAIAEKALPNAPESLRKAAAAIEMQNAGAAAELRHAASSIEEHKVTQAVQNEKKIENTERAISAEVASQRTVQVNDNQTKQDIALRMANQT